MEFRWKWRRRKEFRRTQIRWCHWAVRRWLAGVGRRFRRSVLTATILKAGRARVTVTRTDPGFSEMVERGSCFCQRREREANDTHVFWLFVWSYIVYNNIAFSPTAVLVEANMSLTQRTVTPCPEMTARLYRPRVTTPSNFNFKCRSFSQDLTVCVLHQPFDFGSICQVCGLDIPSTIRLTPSSSNRYA